MNRYMEKVTGKVKNRQRKPLFLKDLLKSEKMKYLKIANTESQKTP